MTIGEKIKKHRTERGFSLRELAKRVDLSASFLSQIEQGKAQWKEKGKRSTAI